MGEVVPVWDIIFTHIIWAQLIPRRPYILHALPLCYNYPVSKCPSASIVMTSTLRVKTVPVRPFCLQADELISDFFFSLSPTPRVTWERKNGDLPDRSHQESYGMELVIEDVEFEDAGQYECVAINEVAPAPIRRSIILSVECKHPNFLLILLVNW